MEQAPSTSRGWQAAQAAATLLPAFALGLPGSGAAGESWAPLAGDLTPESTGAGLALLLSLPAMLLLFARRARTVPASAWWLFLFAGVGYVSLGQRPPVDTFGASRAQLSLFAGLAMYLSGASLDATGRAWLVRGAIVLTGWLLAPTFTGALPSAGALGNSGSTSEIALVGAVVGLTLFARGTKASGLWPWLGAAAALALAVYAGWAPVVAGILCLGLAIALNSFLSLTANEGRWRAAALGLACVFVFGVAWVRTHAPEPGAPPAQVEAPATGDLLGGEVRLRIWRSVARMTRDYGLLGVGPGQFGASFPTYRDPGEIALSSAPELGRETDVEHAHNDWLQGFADTGLGGLAWALFLLGAGWRALRSVRDPEPARAALAAATLAVLANALLRSPFSFNPASTLVFGVLGAGAAHSARVPGTAALSKVVSFRLIGPTLVLMLALTPRALDLVEHGRALASVFEAGDATGIERALDACPDSPAALSIDAQFAKLTGQPEPAAESLAKWQRVLDVRPHRLVAWMEVGRLQAQAHERDAARVAWTRAVTLVPGHPVLCRNLARLEATDGDVEAAVRWLEAAGDASPEALLALASDAVLVGSNATSALALTGRAYPDLAPLGAQSAWNLAETLDESDAFRARWLKGAAHLTWARAHRAAGNLDTAARSYRQAVRTLWFRQARVEELIVADTLLLELAATLAADGRADEARVPLARLRSAHAAEHSPAWVRSALDAAGLLPDS